MIARYLDPLGRYWDGNAAQWTDFWIGKVLGCILGCP